MPKTVTVCGEEYKFTHCINCGVAYIVPIEMWNNQQEKGGFHRCVNGHSQGWTGEDCENARLRRERDFLKQQMACKDDEIKLERDRNETLFRSRAAVQGHLTKVKKRVQAGVCPCCNRTFQNLARHMSSKHPDFDPAEKVGLNGSEAQPTRT